MNVPIRTRSNQEVQTDINLLPDRSTHFLEFTNQSWMLPFSDYFLLSQLNTVIEQLRNNNSNQEQYHTRRIVNQLAAKIHGLLARELQVSSKNAGYYDLLLEKQKQITKLQIKYANYDKKIDSSLNRVQQLERQIVNLRNTLKMYQTVGEENQIYKGFFRQIKDLTVTSQRINDYQKILNQQILPKIKQFEINLAEVSKNAGRDRSSRQKSAISRYAIELDGLAKSRDLSWETLSNSAATFFTSIEHLNPDDWVQHRLGLADSYHQLRTRHTALLSLVSKNVDQLLQKDPAFKNLQEIKAFLRAIEGETRDRFETSIVNGWIGLGVIHCHRHESGVDSETASKLRSLILLFQSELGKLIDKYPQLNDSISSELRQFLKVSISKQEGGVDALGWLQKILVKQVEVVHVDNVYNYYSKSDKESIYYLRILVKSLIDELKRINNDHKIKIELDEGVLQMLSKQALDGINIDDVIALFRPGARVCETEVIVNKLAYETVHNTVGVPLRQQKAIVVTDTKHFAVNLEQGVPYKKQIPYEYSKTEIVQVPVTIEKPYGVPTKVTEEIITYSDHSNIVQVPVDRDHYIEVIRQIQVNTVEQVLATEEVPKYSERPYEVNTGNTREIEVEREVPKNIYKQINKIFKVEQLVPKVYKQPKFQVVEVPVHHTIIDKQYQFVNIQRPVIEKHEVPKIVELIVEKPIYYPEHCDCQKPEAVMIEVEKPVYQESPKEIIIEKCHFVQPNVEERIVQVACHTQVPIYKEVVKQVPCFIDKLVPLRTIQEKLVVVDRQVPYFIEHFTPVEIVIEKPVIVRETKHVPVEVQQPVPIYIEKIVPKIVEVIQEKIVEKIVQVKIVEVVEVIKQKIVVIPRVIERIVPVIQIVEVPVFIETPVLEIVEIPVEKIVFDVCEKEKLIYINSEVLKIEKCYQQVEVVKYQELRSQVQVLPDEIPVIEKDKIIKVREECPVQIYMDRIVDRVIEINNIVPVEQRVEIPIQVQCPVQIYINKPVFYKQPVVQVDIHRVEREKEVQIQKQVIKVVEVQVPYVKIEKQIVYLPGQTIVLKEPELHIIQIEKEKCITVADIEERPVDHYMDLQKAHVIDQQTFVIPEKQVCFLEKPYAVSIEKPVAMKHQQMVVVERPETLIVKARQGLKGQIVKIVNQEKLAIQKQSHPQPIPVPEHHYHLLYEQLPPNSFNKSVLRTDERVTTQQVQSIVEVQGFKEVRTKFIEIPVYMEKIFERILMLPQVVEVEKKVYMIEEINGLIAKEVSLETHYDDYREHMTSVQNAITELLTLINLGQGNQGNTADLKKKLNLLLQLLRTESRIPKIVENIREVEVVRQRDRPVLVPVYDSEREKILHCIIADLIDGIKGLNKSEIEARFPERIRNLFGYQFGLGGIEGETSQFILPESELSGRWKSWLDNYDKNLPNTQPQVPLSEQESLFILGYDSKEIDFATIRASLQRLTIIHKQRLHQIQRLKTQYGTVINELLGKVSQLEGKLANKKHYKDFYFSELIKIRRCLQQNNNAQALSNLSRLTKMTQEVVIDDHYRPEVDQRASGQRAGSQRFGGVRVDSVELSAETQRKLSELLSQLTNYQVDGSQKAREIHTLKEQNERLRNQIDEIQRSVSTGNQDTNNEDWRKKIAELEQNHLRQLNHLREQFLRRLTEGTGNDVAQDYKKLLRELTQVTESKLQLENVKRSLTTNYEDQIRSLKRDIQVVKRDYQSQITRSVTERSRIVDDYERRLTSTSMNKEKDFRSELDQARNQLGQTRKQLDLAQRQLDQARRNLENAEAKCKVQKKKIVDQYQAKLRSTAGANEKELRRELDQVKNQLEQTRRQLDQARRNFENAEAKCKVQKKKIVDQYQAKLRSAGNSEKQLKKQLETVKKNAELAEQRHESEKKKIAEESGEKTNVGGSSQERQLKRQLDSVKKNFENYQKNTEAQKSKSVEEYERRIKQLQDNLDRLKSSRRGTTTTSDQSQELTILREKIRRLEQELTNSKRQVETYQSKLTHTTYTSGGKDNPVQSQFQSPKNRFRTTGSKLGNVAEGSETKVQQQAPQYRSSEVERTRGRISKSGVRGESSLQDEGEEVRSSSSRISGTSESSTFKASMTMKEFMELKKAEDKDSIISLVMIKVLEKIKEEAERGIINSYNPSNIYLSNFQPSNIDALVVRFGAPITNRKSKSDGLYLAPEVLRGEGATLKSVVFTLAVIWDELIHYEIYYKTVADIENLAYEYKVRDTSINPILRNTLFEMMSKDPSKRLELDEAKRRLSLQRYIISDGRAGTTTSRVSTQSRRT